jgi:hypothetical protein
MVPAEGIEPPTFSLQNCCSTTELSRPCLSWKGLRFTHIYQGFYDDQTFSGLNPGPAHTYNV